MKMRASAAKEAMQSSSEEEIDASKLVHLPNFSPVSWLRQDAWTYMSRYEKETFIEHITGGNFQTDRQDVHDHSRYCTTQARYTQDDIDFGNGVDRVVLGRGPR
eukprot:CAMPEP_0201700546 /NCGR_PEP_ID=MMETSP0578-20130828/28979_1 /ASSEMBLY_ACC=CAM_ASM_000663 /TAXON_ID=267565 /ORGANISM="Skeletonema grethea, Strain CCMP 1804" /LENGTH=103 /DNA_ID=CAMNT_0048187625 /DNA_START=41 /DNA_END=349 /DNA_ORIENTATION=+